MEIQCLSNIARAISTKNTKGEERGGEREKKDEPQSETILVWGQSQKE